MPPTRKRGTGSSSGRSRSKQNGNRNGGTNPAEIARTAVALVAQLTGRRPETVLGLKKDEDGWKVTVEIVELSRVPNSTDLLGCYVVTLDDDGELVGYERVRRYLRAQAGGEE